MSKLDPYTLRALARRFKSRKRQILTKLNLANNGNPYSQGRAMELDLQGDNLRTLAGGLDGSNGSCAVCEDIAELKSQLTAATARASELERELGRKEAERVACMLEMAKARRAAQDAEGARDLDRIIGADTADGFVAGGLAQKLHIKGKELECENRTSRMRLTQRDTELAAMGERVARLEACVEAADALTAQLVEVKVAVTTAMHDQHNFTLLNAKLGVYDRARESLTDRKGET